MALIKYNTLPSWTISEQIFWSSIDIQVLCILQEIGLKIQWLNESKNILNSYPPDIVAEYWKNTDVLITEEIKRIKELLAKNPDKKVSRIDWLNGILTAWDISEISPSLEKVSWDAKWRVLALLEGLWTDSEKEYLSN